MPQAGYCSTCRGYVWVTSSKGCPFGHTPDQVRDVHLTRKLPEPVATPSPVDPATAAAEAEVRPASTDIPAGVVPVAQPDAASPAPTTATIAVTKESVDILNRRIWAFVMDYFVVFVIQLGIAIGAATTHIALGGDAQADTPLLDGLILGMSAFVLYGYFFYLEGRFGATFGKRFFGLRVVNAQGQPISWAQSFVRNAGRFIDMWLFGIVGLLTAGFSPYRQRLGDRWARTYVVRL